MILVVGSTGVLGGEICRLLSEAGRPVRALVRPGADAEKLNRLAALHAEIAFGDLKDADSISKACRGATAVISTATSMVSRRKGDSIASVDRDGQLKLVDAARGAGVSRFLFFSFPPTDVDFPLQHAKRRVEESLRQSGLAYTVLQTAFFMENFLSPAAGFDLGRAEARLYGTGTRPISWISYRDVARFAVAFLDRDDTANSILPIGGPEALTPIEVVKIFEKVSGRPFSVTLVGERSLAEMRRTAPSDVAESFAALGLFYARGCPVDMTETLRRFPLELTSVSDYARALTSSTRKAVPR